MKKSIFIVSLACILITSACSLSPNTGRTGLVNTSWSLVRFGDKKLLPGTVMTATFEKDQVSGSASCNHYFGGYLLKGDKIEISGMGWTEMACMDPEGVMQQEQEIMQLMANAASYDVRGSELVIRTASGKTLIFEELLPSE